MYCKNRPYSFFYCQRIVKGSLVNLFIRGLNKHSMRLLTIFYILDYRATRLKNQLYSCNAPEK